MGSRSCPGFEPSVTRKGIPLQRGLIPRSFQHIFESISVAENTKFLVRASYLEIYNEEIRDLLAVNSKQKLDLKENPDRGVYVKSLSHHQVSSGLFSIENLSPASQNDVFVANNLHKLKQVGDL